MTLEASKKGQLEKCGAETFVYDENDEFYMAPALFRLIHYRNGAILCGITEVIALIITVSAYFSKCYLCFFSVLKCFK